MRDSGIVEICTVIEKHVDGQMPTKQLRPFEQHYFEDRVVGYGRQYAAKGVSQQVDKLIRIDRDESIEIGMVARIGSLTYGIDNIQHLLDEHNLKCTDLTLSRFEEDFDDDDD